MIYKFQVFLSTQKSNDRCCKCVKIRIYKSEIIGSVESSDFVVDPRIELKVGALVSTVINHPDNYFVNGSIGKITELGDSYIMVKFPGIARPLQIPMNLWSVYDYTIDEAGKFQKNIIGTYSQLPVRLAYATTIHKSQGATYDEINLNPKCWAPGQLYVALSRMKNIRKLYLISSITEDSLIADQDVLEFYEHLFEFIPAPIKKVGRPKQLTGSTVVKRIPEELSDEFDELIQTWINMGSNRYNYEFACIPRGMKLTLDLFVKRYTSGIGQIEYINDPNDMNISNLPHK